MGWKIGLNRKEFVTVDVKYWNRNEAKIIYQTKNFK